MRRVAGYVRVSSVGGRSGESFQSPGEQEQAIRAHCQARGHELAEVVRELDASGGTMARTGLQRLLAGIEAGTLDGIVVARLDRFSRTLVGGVQALEQVTGAGGFVQSADGSIDTRANGTAVGTMQQNILLTLAQWERSAKAEGLESAKRNAVARGVHISGKSPTGYLRPGRGERLVIDPSKAPAVKAAFKRRASGATLGDVVALLNQRLPGGPSGEGVWNRGTVTRLLANPVYTGEARQGENRNPDGHPPLVSVEVWDTVQALSRRPERATNDRARALLAGVVRCGSCGYALERNKVAGSYYVYRCRGHSATGDCEAPSSAMVHALDSLVTGAVLERLDGLAVEQVQANDDAAELHEQLAAARAKRTPFEDPDYVAVLGVPAATRALAVVDAEILGLEQQLADTVSVSSSTPIPAGTARELWPTLTTGERRQVLGAMVDAIVVSRSPVRRGPLADRVAVAWRGEGVAVARPSRGRRHNAEAVAGMAPA